MVSISTTYVYNTKKRNESPVKVEKPVTAGGTF